MKGTVFGMVSVRTDWRPFQHPRSALGDAGPSYLKSKTIVCFPAARAPAPRAAPSAR